MVKVQDLTESELEDLEAGYRNNEKHHFRQRCKGILLSNDGFSVPQIAAILKKQDDTIYGWIKSFGRLGIEGLHNAKGQGLKAKLDSISLAQEARLKDLLDRNPQNLKKICAILSGEFGFKITKWILSSYVKKNGTIPGGEFGNG
jgi:transposase